MDQETREAEYREWRKQPLTIELFNYLKALTLTFSLESVLDADLSNQNVGTVLAREKAIGRALAYKAVNDFLTIDLRTETSTLDEIKANEQDKQQQLL